jgi:hypothetical protein
MKADEAKARRTRPKRKRTRAKESTKEERRNHSAPPSTRISRVKVAEAPDVGAAVVAFEVAPSQIRRVEISRETGVQGGPELWPRARQKLLTERPLDAFDRSRCSFLDGCHSS